MTLDHSKDLRDKILEVLGIDPKEVVGVEIVLRRGRMPTAIIERSLPVEEVRKVIGVMDTFVLRTELKSREPVVGGGE